MVERFNFYTANEIGQSYMAKADDGEWVAHEDYAASERAREEAEARLRVLTWHINKHKKEWTSYEPFLDEMLAIISGDLPPCPECAKANAKLAAVGEMAKKIRNERFLRLLTKDPEGGSLSALTKNLAELDAILASDPEAIAVVEGTIRGSSAGAVLVEVHLGEEVAHRGPVTVTVTRKGEGE